MTPTTPRARRTRQRAGLPADPLASSTPAADDTAPAPPKDSAPSTPKPPKASGGTAGGRPRNSDRIAAAAAAYYAMAGQALVAVGAFTGRGSVVGQALMDNADRIGQAYAQWAATNPKVERFLTSALTASGGFAVLAAHAPVAMAIAAELRGDTPAVDPLGLLGTLLAGDTAEPAAA